MCILSLYLQMYDASCTCTNRSYGIRESRWKLYRSLRQVLNWAAMSYLFLCRLFLPSEQLYCQFLSSSLNSRRCFQTFCHLTTRKRKGNTFYKRKLHKAFWDLHFTSFKLSVALFVRLNCLCTGGIDQTDTTVKYACTELGVIHFTVHAIRIPGCVYGKGVRAKIVSFTHISYNY